MTTLSTLEVLISDKDYYLIATNIFQKYANDNFEIKLFWESIKIAFENQTKKYGDIINSKI